MTIDQLAESVAGHLLRRGFVHDDPAAYRAGVRDAVAAIRAAAAQDAVVDRRGPVDRLVGRDELVASGRASGVA